MKTASFHLYTGPGRISIARTPPRYGTAAFRAYPVLAPGAWLFDPKYNNDYRRYRERYFREILASLDARKVWDELHRLAGVHEPVLLCHEHYPTLKPKDWCHRRMVAEWFAETLGAEVSEIIPEKPHASTAQLALLAEV